MPEHGGIGDVQDSAATVSGGNDTPQECVETWQAAKGPHAGEKAVMTSHTESVDQHQQSNE